MMLLRFAALVMATVAAIVAVALLDTWPSVVVAIAVTLGLLALAMFDLSRHLADGDEPSARDDQSARG